MKSKALSAIPAAVRSVGRLAAAPGKVFLRADVRSNAFGSD